MYWHGGSNSIPIVKKIVLVLIIFVLQKLLEKRKNNFLFLIYYIMRNGNKIRDHEFRKYCKIILEPLSSSRIRSTSLIEDRFN